MSASGDDDRGAYTPMAKAVLEVAYSRAVHCGDDTIRTEHLLHALIGVPSIARILRRARVDVATVARDLDRACEACRARAATNTDEAAFRSGAAAPPRTFDSDANDTILRAVHHAEAKQRTDASALFLSELDREREVRGSLFTALSRRLRDIPAPSDTWLLAHGASWMSIVIPMLDERTARGERADERCPDLEGKGFDVVLYNDDTTSFEFVIAVLQRELEYSQVRAHWVASTVHHAGEAVLARLPRDDAHATAARLEAAAREAGYPLRAAPRVGS